MGNYLLLLFSVGVNVVAYGILRSIYCKREVRSDVDIYVFNTVSNACSVMMLLVIAGISGRLGMPSGYTVMMGIIFGLFITLSNLFNLKALNAGPLSYTNAISTCSMVIPALSGLVLYGEPVTVWQYIGIGCMLASFALAIDTKNDRLSTSFRWFAYCLIAFFSGGLLGIMQKLHQNSVHKDEFSSYLIVAFSVSTVLSVAIALYQRGIKRQKASVLMRGALGKLFLIGGFCGIGVAICHQVNLYLTGVMDSIIFFPVVNGGSMILNACVGILLWKERPSKRQWIGLLISVAAILLLCNIIR